MITNKKKTKMFMHHWFPIELVDRIKNHREEKKSGYQSNFTAQVMYLLYYALDKIEIEQEGKDE